MRQVVISFGSQYNYFNETTIYGHMYVDVRDFSISFIYLQVEVSSLSSEVSKMPPNPTSTVMVQSKKKRMCCV